ncbi:hypothetical protein T265_11359 [Opisthorchis viverrini]|uniref:Uncharacterized protein n=1 Tax=Opisthorchis viverrini TaxID=6198 RepID=A0A074Z395_OPIVI|nr:hypothetical protein T265_11359 [Opisthorchis viverrini]KER19992.1 hypothetical protein T265_11359 [Opisthorchis viverrini]
MANDGPSYPHLYVIPLIFATCSEHQASILAKETYDYYLIEYLPLFVTLSPFRAVTTTRKSFSNAPF